MDNWDEIRTAYFVAREGTVSRAAELLGIHHATVIRHIDSLEARIQAKLFQRHARGYTPTEAGQELLRVGQATHEQLSQLDAFIRGKSDAVEGELVITSLIQLAPRIMPHLRSFQEQHPDVTLRYMASDRVFRLEYGEAHVAIRAAETAPDDPDNVVQHLCRADMSLYAAQSYIEAYGAPEPGDYASYAEHRFVGAADPNARAPFARWLTAHVPESAIVFRTDETPISEAAIRAGIGLGFLPDGAEEAIPELVKVDGPRDVWSSDLWLVTHMDLHRSAKVQAITRFLKQALAL